MKPRFAAWCLVILCCTSAVSARRQHSILLHGRVVAFRPAERLGQVVSGVVNQEVFLLRLDNDNGRIVKVVYEHDGYSKLPNGGMRLSTRRDRSCDGKYGQFVSEAPVLPSEDGTDSVPPITLLEGFKGLLAEAGLPCYRLGPGGIQTESPNH